MIIAGIGSRKTPKSVLEVMENFARTAAAMGTWFRSGHADGADYAFEKGAEQQCIVYLPWDGFNHQAKILGLPRSLNIIDERAFKIVLKHEPYAASCSNGVKLLKCRNVYQILGESLDKPCDLVICWTQDGEIAGGTGLAIKIANELKIPIMNLGIVPDGCLNEKMIWTSIEKDAPELFAKFNGEQ